jgi:hypothetical protein
VITKTYFFNTLVFFLDDANRPVSSMTLLPLEHCALMEMEIDLSFHIEFQIRDLCTFMGERMGKSSVT